MGNFKYKFFLFFLFYFINQTQSQNLINGINATQYNCLVDLMIKSTTNIVPINQTNGYYDFDVGNKDFYVNLYYNGDVSYLYVYQNKNTTISYSDILCLQPLNYMSFLNSTQSSFESIFSYNGSSKNKLYTMVVYFYDSNGLFGFPNIADVFNQVNIYIKLQPTDLYINFSQIKTTTQFNFGDSSVYAQNSRNSSNFKVYFINDLQYSNGSFPSMILFSQNFPSFNFIKGLQSVYLNSGFDQDSLSQNIQTIANLSALSIYSNTDLFKFPTNIETIKSTTLQSLLFEMKFDTPTQLINLSNISSIFNKITFQKVGTKFNFNNNIPFIGSKDLTSLVFTDGNISKFNFSEYVTNYPKITTLSLKNNSIGSEMGIYNPPLSLLDSLDLSNNKLTGTIDESFCQIKNLVVTNNLLNGSIPTCFTCWIAGSGQLKLNLQGNLFITDINNPPPCPTVPNIVKESVNSFWIFGNFVTSFYTSPTVKYGQNNYASISQVNNQFKITLPANIITPKVVDLIYYNGYSYQRTYTLALEPNKPIIDSVSWFSNDLVFYGSYFSYNTSIVSIQISNINCLVNGLTFYQINCTIANPIISNDNIAIVKVGDLYSQILISPNKLNAIYNCSLFDDCNFQTNNGYCNTTEGLCSCSSNWQNSNCSEPVKQCPMVNSVLCSGRGSCNNETGVCECLTNPISWGGIDCSLPTQFVSSIDSAFTSGGNTTFYGWFGDVHKDLSILIGGKQCLPITSITNQSISCNAPPGIGLQSLSITQNNYTWSKESFYRYKSIEIQCLNDCSSNGNCNTTNGYCTCQGIYSGPDCSLIKNINESTTPSINETTGSTNININQKSYFEILIYSLVEIDINGNSVLTTPLQINWNISKTSESIYNFTQTIQNNQCTIQYIIEELNTTKQFTFADLTFTVESGSIKTSINIFNYQYQNSLNTLQLLMKTTINSIKSSDNTNDCNDSDSKINVLNSNDLLNYITLEKDSKILTGRFIDRVISDGRSTFLSTSIIEKTNDTIIVSLNLPHFSKSISIDPDYSVLLSSEFKSTCSDNDKSRSWLIPVVVVVPIVCCAAIIALLIYITKTHTFKILSHGKLTKLKKMF